MVYPTSGSNNFSICILFERLISLKGPKTQYVGWACGKGDLNLSGVWSKLFSVSSEAGGTSAVSLDRSPGSLETSGGPECGAARFGAAHKPGLIIVHPALSLNPAFSTSKNLPVIHPVYQKDASGLRFPFTPRALSGWYVPSPDLVSRLWAYLNGRNAEYSGAFASSIARPVLKPDREEKGLGLEGMWQI